MDDERFDQLARLLGMPGTRRTALTAALGATVAALAGGVAVAAKQPKPKHKHAGKDTHKAKAKANGNRGGDAKRHHHHHQDQPAAAGQKCTQQGQPCEGKQTCCAPYVCLGGGKSVAMRCLPCLPKTCADLGANCGTTRDDCGGTLNCGTCSGKNTCGGGGTANVCGCTPTTCAKEGKNCSTIPD